MPTSSTQRALRIYVIFLIAIFATEWSYAGYHNFILHTPYPTTTPLFDPDGRLSDWTNFLPRISHYGEPGMQLRTDLGLPYPYPLPSLYIFLFFLRVFHNPITAYVHVTVLIFTVATLLFWTYLYRRTSATRLVLFSVWITFLLGSPAQFLLDRGNIEVFIWLFVLAGLVSFVREWKYLAAFFFALAACMKIYPAIFFLLFLARRQYKAAVLGIALTVGFSVAALAAVGPTIPQAFHNLAPAALALRNAQVIALWRPILRWDHSLLALWKQAYYILRLPAHPGFIKFPPTFERALRVYSILAPLVFAAIYVLRIRRLPILNQFMALSIFSVILPYVSYDYTLVHIYLVFAAFILFLVQDADAALVALRGWKLTTVLVCFAIIFSPLAWLAFEFYQGQVKAIALVVLLIMVLLTPMPSTLFRDRRLQHVTPRAQTTPVGDELLQS